MNTEVNTEVSNPYSAPKVNIQAPLASDGEPHEVRIFAIAGRIGRVRYIGYTIGLSFLIMFAGSILGALTFGIGLVIAYIALLVMQIMLTIQRCHDFNTSGWLAILALIPLVGLIFWFIPGTDGPNNFGNKTAPNSTATTVLACIVPIVIIGVLAAVAIPAYQGYVERAKASRSR